MAGRGSADLRVAPDPPHVSASQAVTTGNRAKALRTVYTAPTEAAAWDRFLEPALRTARRDAETTRLGQHRRANRAVDAAQEAVDDQRARIHAAEHDAQPARQRYEAVTAEARRLERLAEPDALIDYLEAQRRVPLERLIDARQRRSRPWQSCGRARFAGWRTDSVTTEGC